MHSALIILLLLRPFSGNIKADTSEEISVVDIEHRLFSGMDTINKTAKAIEDRIRFLERKEERMVQLGLRMAENAAAANARIKLDIGGKIFATQKTNLLKFEGSYFHAMLSSGHWQPNEEGSNLSSNMPTSLCPWC